VLCKSGQILGQGRDGFQIRITSNEVERPTLRKGNRGRCALDYTMVDIELGGIDMNGGADDDGEEREHYSTSPHWAGASVIGPV
jgi:hypothetical protein